MKRTARNQWPTLGGRAALIPRVVRLSLLALAPVVSLGQNLLVNGSFEEPSMAGVGDLYSSQAGFTLPGWTYPPQPMRFFLEYGQPAGFPRFADGNQAVCLNGEGTPASIAQTFATTPGQNYVLSYAVAYPTGPGPTSSLVASVAGLSRSFVPSGGTNYVLQSWQFTAPSNSATLAFTDSHLLGSAPTFLDAVSVLPGSALLAGINTPIPGGMGTFTAYPTDPCLSGGNVVFSGQGVSGQQGIYVQWPPEPMKVVADLNTAIPGGSFGNFTTFWPPDPVHPTDPVYPPEPMISGNNVVFTGFGTNVQGIYAQFPPDPIKVIADTTTAIPGGTGNFIGFTQAGYPPEPIRPSDPCVSGNNVAFWGAGSGGQEGIYVQYPPDPMKVIADTSTAIPNGAGNFSAFPPNPWISGDSVAFVASGPGGQQGVYVKLRPTDPCRVVADTNTPIPGGTGNFVAFPPNPLISGSTVAFIGNGSSGQQGVYVEWPPNPIYPPNPMYPPGPMRVADLNTPIPGSSGTFSGFSAVSLSGDTVAFLGTGTNGQQGIYISWPPEPIFPPGPMFPPSPIYPPVPMKVLDLNDQLDGKTISSLRLGRGGLDGGLLAYGATFTDGTQGLYTLAVPMALRITALWPPEPGRSQDMQISFTTLLAHNYVLQARSDLAGGAWTTLPGVFIGTGGIVQTTIANALTQPQQFYRVQQQ